MDFKSLIYVHEEMVTGVLPLNELKAVGLFVWQWAAWTVIAIWGLLVLMAGLAAVASYWTDLGQAPLCTLFITRQKIAKEEKEAAEAAEAAEKEAAEAARKAENAKKAAADAKEKAAAEAAKSKEQLALELEEKRKLEYDEWRSNLTQQITKSFSDWCDDKAAAKTAKAAKTQEQLDLEKAEERETIYKVLCGISATPSTRYTLKRLVRDPNRVPFLIQVFLCGTSAFLCVASTSGNLYRAATLSGLVFFVVSLPDSASIRAMLVRIVIGLLELLFFFVLQALCNAIWAGLSQLNSNLAELIILVQAPCSCTCKLFFYIACVVLAAPNNHAALGFLNANSSAGPWEAFDSPLFPAFCPLHDGFSVSTALELLVRVWYTVHWIPTLWTLLVTWYRDDQPNTYAVETMADLQRRTSLINRQISAVPTAETIANSTPISALFLASVQIVYHITGVWSLGPCILTFAVCGGWWVTVTVCLATRESVPDMILVTILKWGFTYLHVSFLTGMTKLVRTVRTVVQTVQTAGGPPLTYAQQCDAYHQARVDFPIAADAVKLSALGFTVGSFLVLTVMYAFASIPDDSAKEASSITDKAMLKTTLVAEDRRISARILRGKPCSKPERLLHASVQFGEQLHEPQRAPLPPAQ